MRVRFSATVFSVIVLCAVTAVARVWSDKTGKFKIEADFVALKDERVTLKKPSGTEIVVPLDKLSEADQEVARTLALGTDEERQEKAEDLIKQAKELLKLDPRTNAKLAGNKLREASAANPASIKADYMLGLLNTLIAHNSQLALKNFEECLKRDATNLSVLNNLAVTEAKRKKYGQALEHWKTAIKLSSGGSLEITQNLGRLVRIHGRQIKLSPAILKQASDMYAAAVSGGRFPAADPRVGWLYMPLFEDTDTALLKNTDSEIDEIEKTANESNNQNMRILSGGTGFVVGKNLILTNRHVVKGADGLLISHSSFKKAKRAQIVAVADKMDIAIVRCEGLELPSVPISPKLPRRGSDILVLGYPHFSEIGVNLKATRGTITSTPSAATDGMMLVDAEINSGNSGGPMANNRGRVVAVSTAVFQLKTGTGGRYGAGIPTSSALAFVKKHVSDIELPKGDGIELDWPDVDELVSFSTVLILNQKRMIDTGLTPDQATGKGHGVYYQDLTCPGCDYKRQIRKGNRNVPCPHCRGSGVDLSLRAVQPPPKKKTR
jgi:S1-C subfamily serine protease